MGAAVCLTAATPPLHSTLLGNAEKSTAASAFAFLPSLHLWRGLGLLGWAGLAWVGWVVRALSSASLVMRYSRPCAEYIA